MLWRERQSRRDLLQGLKAVLHFDGAALEAEMGEEIGYHHDNSHTDGMRVAQVSRTAQVTTPPTPLGMKSTVRKLA